MTTFYYNFLCEKNSRVLEFIERPSYAENINTSETANIVHVFSILAYHHVDFE